MYGIMEFQRAIGKPKNACRKTRGNSTGNAVARFSYIDNYCFHCCIPVQDSVGSGSTLGNGINKLFIIYDNWSRKEGSTLK